MIDEKKIEEAAKSHVFAEYSEGDFPVKISEIKEQCESDFKAGTNWAQEEFKKSLWHDASEEPDYLGRRILYEYKPNGVINPSTRIKEASLPEKLHWKKFSYKPINPERIITRWLYIDDLLEKKGGE